MMMTETAPATEAVQTSTALYFVVPVTPDNNTESVYYFRQDDPRALEWKLIAPADLNAKASGCTANQIQLCIPTALAIQTHAILPSGTFDPSVSLFVGVARTLCTGPDPFSATYLPDQGGVMTIPVEPNTTRGLIVVFIKAAANGMLPEQLIASTDPEIKNGV